MTRTRSARKQQKLSKFHRCQRATAAPLPPYPSTVRPFQERKKRPQKKEEKIQRDRESATESNRSEPLLFLPLPPHSHRNHALFNRLVSSSLPSFLWLICIFPFPWVLGLGPFERRTDFVLLVRHLLQGAEFQLHLQAGCCFGFRRFVVSLFGGFVS